MEKLDIAGASACPVCGHVIANMLINISGPSFKCPNCKKAEYSQFIHYKLK